MKAEIIIPKGWQLMKTGEILPEGEVREFVSEEMVWARCDLKGEIGKYFNGIFIWRKSQPTNKRKEA